MTLLYKQPRRTKPKPRTTRGAYNATHRVADAQVKPMADAFLAILNHLRASTSTADIHNLLYTRDARAISAAIPFDLGTGLVAKAVETQPLEDTVYHLLIGGWDVGAGVSGYFDVKSQEMIDAARTYAANMVSGISSTTRDSIQQLISGGIANGRTPMDTAQAIRDTIGLTPQQATAVANYRQGLVDVAGGNRSADNLLASYALHDSRYGLNNLTSDKIDKLTDRYAQRQLNYRANQIAHTETMKAANLGNQMNWRAAADAGYVDATTMGQEWITTDDDMLCDDCAELDGEVVGLYDNFSSGDDGPPMHPGCRCTIGMAELDTGDPGAGSVPDDADITDTDNSDAIDASLADAFSNLGGDAGEADAADTADAMDTGEGGITSSADPWTAAMDDLAATYGDVQPLDWQVNQQGVRVKTVANDYMATMMNQPAADTLMDTSPELRYAQRFYTGSGYRPLNQALRTLSLDPAMPIVEWKQAIPLAANDALAGGMNTVGEVVTNLDALIQSGTTTEDVVVYRGISEGAADEFEDLEAGEWFHDKGYVSTTLNPELHFVRDNPVQLEIVVPAGTNGYYTGELGETELTLGRDSRFLITERMDFFDKYGDAKVRFKAIVIPPEVS